MYLFSSSVVLGIGFLLYSVEALEFGCQNDYCDRFVKSCPSIDESESGRILKNATKCGCCDVLMISMKKDDNCFSTENKPIPRSECGFQLTCDPATLKCKDANTKCMRDLRQFEQTIGENEMTMWRPKPKCDEVGKYAPVQCKAGLMCKCFDEDGNRLFGEAPDVESETMNCQCSRDLDRFVKAGLLKSNTNSFLRCTANGDYDGPQCTETHCYCIGKNGELRSQQVPRANGTSVLPCFDQKLHHKNFITPCLSDREGLLKQTKEFQDEGKIILGIDLPVCDPDGSYASKQCYNDNCYCVDKFGKRFNNTGVKRYSQEEVDMTYCNCVREKQYLKDIVPRSNQFAQYKCNSNGDYLPIQCTTSVCFCVDPVDGFQIGNPMLIAERKNLKCYRTEYDNQLNIIWA